MRGQDGAAARGGGDGGAEGGAVGGAGGGAVGGTWGLEQKGKIQGGRMGEVGEEVMEGCLGRPEGVNHASM